LRHVTGFANLLSRHAGERLDAQGRRYLTTITDSAARMATLIDDLLAFSRMGRAGLTKRRVDLTALVQEARDEVAADVNGRRIVWTVDPLPIVDGDPALLRPMLVNLLSNAVKYSSTREEARIDVGTTAGTDSEVVVYVRDNGVGFDMTYAHKLFGVFQRLHRAEDFEGTGIGLANIRRIITRHGGRTWAEGKPDAGATFYFTLPKSRKPPT
jgi:light-regulated signal transduction histidine kinase (bacteriophytochrome)